MLHKCYCGPVGKYLGHMLYELFAPRGLSSRKSVPKRTFAKCSRLCAAAPSSALTPSLGTAAARHSACALQDFPAKERICGQSRGAEAVSGGEVETWLPPMLVGSCGAVAPGVWQRAELLESVQLRGKWKHSYLKHTYNPALDKALSLLGEEGN